MPSFLSQDTSPSYSTNLDFINFNLDGPFDHDDGSLVLEKAQHREEHHEIRHDGLHNGLLLPHHDPSHNPSLAAGRDANSRLLHRVNGSFDDSTSSAHTSDLSYSAPLSTANGTRPGSASSLENPTTTTTTTTTMAGFGTAVANGGGMDTSFDGFDKSRTSGIRDTRLSSASAPPNGRAEQPPHHTQHTQHTQHAQHSSIRHSADDAKLGARPDHPERFSQQSLAPPSPFGPATPAFATAPSSPDASRKSPQPSRLSGQASPMPTPSASSMAFPSPNLTQRRTLEVPRSAPARASKDSSDTAFATGRFSPTSAGPSTGRRSSINLGRRNTRSGEAAPPRDEVAPDEDAKRWTEAYRQKMAASKRRKREEEELDDRVVVGTKVDESHASWATAYNMLTGIRVSVSRTNAKLDRALTDADFDIKQKSTFDITGNELVPSAKYDFKFKDYAPWVFRHLRALFQLDPADYLMSLTGKYILSMLGSPGKSGSFFYFSRDYKYIIKTIHHAEHKFLRKILKHYYQHVAENPNTLLSQFYGLHRVKVPYGRKIHFVVMNNLFPPHRDIHTTFDLKGSTIGRNYAEDKLAENPRATLKDLNWLRRQRSLELGLHKKKLFLEQLQRDVALLKKLDIMDYSLLVGIHDLRKGNEEKLRDKTLQVFNPGGERTSEDEHPSVLLRTPSKLENARKAKELRHMVRSERPVPLGQTPDRMPDELDAPENQSVFYQDEGGFRATHEDDSPADEVYYLGVIDCLTHYGMIKKIEHFWKGLGSDRSQISALPPDQYGDRFYRFIEGITLSPEEARRVALARQAEAEEAALAAAAAEQQRPGSQLSNAPSPALHDSRSPEAQAVIDRAEQEARRSELAGMREQDVPERTRSAQSDKRTSNHGETTILPVVEEAGEASSTGSTKHDRDSIRDRPTTPSLPVLGPPPQTPPKDGYLKPNSSDSGYAGHGHPNGHPLHSESPPRIKPRLSMESLNKDLPPLPGGHGLRAGVF